jgi:selenocysteine lyase/cysteine desulfurase
MESKKNFFQLPNEVSYLNCANIAPLSNESIKSGRHALETRQKPYLISREDWFDPVTQLKQEFAQLINCGDHRRIVLVPSVSYGIATVVKNVPITAGEEVIVIGEQYPSNYYSWKSKVESSGGSIEVIYAPKDNRERSTVWNRKILESISTKTKVVAIGNVHWTDGTWFDLETISKRAKECNALLVIDGSQSIGALPFDVQKIKPDALFTVGYKWLLGPFALGLGYLGDFFDNGTPLEENWVNRKDGRNFENLVNYTDWYGPVATRYNMGENSNFHLVPILETSVRQLNEWGPSNIQAHGHKLSRCIKNELKPFGAVFDESEHTVGHLLGVRFDRKVNLQQLHEKLIASRVHVSLRGEVIRISLNVFNDLNDVDKLVSSVKTMIAN